MVKDDIFNDPGFKAYAQHFLDNVAPGMKKSAYVMVIGPMGGMADVKIALEIGYAILLGKPLVVIKFPGRVVAEKLLRIADHVIEGDLTTEAGQTSVMEQFARITNQ